MTTIALKKFYNGLTKTDSLLYGYQFDVEFHIPEDFKEVIENGKDVDTKNMSFLVQSTTVPPLTLKTGTTSFLGNQFQSPGVASFDHNWSCNFILLENLAPYRMFRAWMNIISNLNSSGGGEREIKDAYARVSVLDSSLQARIRSFVLTGIWPSSVGNIQLAYQNGGGNTVQFPVSFKYQYWYRDDGFDNKGNPLTAESTARVKPAAMQPAQTFRRQDKTKALTPTTQPANSEALDLTRRIDDNEASLEIGWLFVYIRYLSLNHIKNLEFLIIFIKFKDFSRTFIPNL